MGLHPKEFWTLAHVIRFFVFRGPFSFFRQVHDEHLMAESTNYWTYPWNKPGTWKLLGIWYVSSLDVFFQIRAARFWRGRVLYISCLWISLVATQVVERTDISLHPCGPQPSDLDVCWHSTRTSEIGRKSQNIETYSHMHHIYVYD